MWRGSESFAIVIAFTDAAAKSDVTVTNGYNEAGDDYGLKYKEKGSCPQRVPPSKAMTKRRKHLLPLFPETPYPSFPERTLASPAPRSLPIMT